MTTTEMPAVFITGGSRGLGRALAEHLASSAVVYTTGRTDPAESHPAITHFGGLDLALTEDLETLAPILASCDWLVCNAAMAPDGLLATMSESAILDAVQLNLSATILITRLWLRERVRARKSGAWVGISSIISIRGYAGLGVYSATKAGLDGFARAMAREMGGRGFRFNTVQPGYFDSAMSASLAGRQRDQIVRRTPLGRLATVSDIAPVVEFLLSADAGFITGQGLTVDGGITV